ncbi:hypothetical protein [Castellaniella caeni]|uniref:hypothetical protein n=1 Tax=Castellaniella caeni TaxID=266123 RepID=UPI000C9FBA6D|nr:hypothetical protein [Castellaniella caeni]
MTTIFVAGSINIKNLDRQVRERLDRIIDSGFSIVVGDADGADSSIQSYLAGKQAQHITVFCSGENPRNNLGGWPVHHVAAKASPGTRAFFTAKDIEMARVADYGLMIWDAKSTGTLSNVLELLQQKKKAVVFVNKDKDFVNVGSLEQLHNLLSRMSSHAHMKAEQKIGLSSKLNALKYEQSEMFAH